MAGMNWNSGIVLAFTIIRWIAMLGLLGYGIFAGKSWAIAAGVAVAIVGLIYSSTAFAARSRNKH